MRAAAGICLALSRACLSMLASLSNPTTEKPERAPSSASGTVILPVPHASSSTDFRMQAFRETYIKDYVLFIAHVLEIVFIGSSVEIGHMQCSLS